jgi:hypothetical protein
LLGRRFRRGLDYSLAASHDSEPRLEISLGLTPTPGWGTDEEVEDVEENESEKKTNGSRKKANGKAKANGKKKEEEEQLEEDDDVGGHEVYMAGDNEDDDEDAAIYKASSDAEDDNVLFTMPASWNKMSIVLRDSGVLKFVKYISKNAMGDRWDVSGAFGVHLDEGEVEGEDEMVTLGESSDEEAFKGFPDSEESDSD